MQKRPPVVVIGAGMGGLAAAIRLQARGFQVTVVDRRDAPGGRAYVYREGGYTFDGGPTVVTAAWLISELFELAGKKADDYVKFVELDPYYQIRFTTDGRVFNYSGNHEKMMAEVERFSPDGADGYRRFLVQSEKIFKKGFEELADIPFSSFFDMVKVAPSLIKLKSHQSVYKMISKYFKDEGLRQVMSFHPLLIGGNPFDASSIYAMIHFLEQKWGVHFAMGGTGAIISSMVKLFGELGGELRLGETVEEVVVENANGHGRRCTGVRLAGSGTTLPADYVVSNADPGWLYKHLIAPQHRPTWSDRKIGKKRFSMSLFVAYFGTDRRYEDVAHHTIIMGPRYRELLDDIFRKKILADDFSLYLHRPTKTDRSLAPDGCDAFYVLSPVPHNSSGIDWKTMAEPYRDKLLDYLEKTMMPGLRGSIKVMSHITPETFESEMLSLHGAAFSLEPILTQSAWFRPHNQAEDIRNLLLVGAGTHPGAGMPGVLCSARIVDRLVPRLDGDSGLDPIAGTHARA